MIRTFGQLVYEVTSFIKQGFLEGNFIHVVSDFYAYEGSIKSGEHKHRARKKLSDSQKLGFLM